MDLRCLSTENQFQPARIQRRQLSNTVDIEFFQKDFPAHTPDAGDHPHL